MLERVSDDARVYDARKEHEESNVVTLKCIDWASLQTFAESDGATTPDLSASVLAVAQLSSVLAEPRRRASDKHRGRVRVMHHMHRTHEVVHNTHDNNAKSNNRTGTRHGDGGRRYN